jgi:hypothetical protein
LPVQAVAPVVLLHHAAAVRAGGGQRGVVARHGVAVVFLGLLDHALGHGGNLAHEGVAAELAVLHLRQLVFPLAGQLGLGELFHAQAAQQRHELEGLGGGDQLAAFAQHVFLVQQAFDDGCARGRRAQAFFLHGLAQLVVVHQLAGAFHGAQQRGFGVARGRAGLQALGLDDLGAHHLARLHRHQALALVAFLGIRHFVRRFLAVDGQPAGRTSTLPSVLKLWPTACEMRVVTWYSALGKNTAMKRRTTRSYSFCSASDRPWAPAVWE